MEVAHPTVSRQTKAIGGNTLDVARLTDRLDDSLAQSFVQLLLLSVLPVKALMGVGAVVFPWLK